MKVVRRLYSKHSLLEQVSKNTNFHLLRKKLEKEERYQIPVLEFLALSQNFGVSENDAKALVQNWSESGVFLLENDNLIIKPELIYKKFYDSVQVKDEVFNLQQEKEKLEQQIAPLEQQKSVLDLLAKKSLTRTSWASTVYLTFQLGVLMHMTWIDYGWDVVEPLTYFCTFSVAYIGVIYYTLFKQEYQYDDVYTRLLKRKKAKIYSKNSFDIATYEKIKEAIAKIEQEISAKKLL